jgi:hypothetical protein|tara:strand:- start:55 stop:261 length:207 start_codon:yes stop_codon:yes gene_type:complete
MTQELRVVYKDSDKSIIGLLGADLDHGDHESRSVDGVKVAPQILEFPDDVIVMPEMVSITSDGVATKV